LDEVDTDEERSAGAEKDKKGADYDQRRQPVARRHWSIADVLHVASAFV
jgi:hypothetical protein